MRVRLTVEERIALAVLLALLACVAVASLKGVLEMTPRTITNSNASTWGKGAGLICVDANYIYISTGTNTWKRAALGW